MTTIIPEYPTLYILNTNNKIYQWSIKIELLEDNTYNILTSHGQKDGKLVTHNSHIEKGKVKRNILEQAILEADRKWKNKKEKELYSEKLSDDIKINDIIVRPMLANKFNFDLYKKNTKSFKIQFPAYIQRKYDGIRCLAYLKNNEVIMESRTGHAFDNFELLKDHLKSLLNNFPSNFYFDGELYTDDIDDFEVISGLVRLSNKKCSEEDKLLINKIQFHIYDFFDANNQNIIYEERYTILNKFFKDYAESNILFKNVETYLIDKLEDVKTYHDNFVKDGYEGIMIRDRQGIYEINKRSKYLQKFKEFIEEEFKIVGFHEGTGDEEGAIIWDCITKEDKLFSVRPRGTFESRKKLFNEGDKYIGNLLTVIFQEYTNDNIPRFPVGKSVRINY